MAGGAGDVARQCFGRSVFTQPRPETDVGVAQQQCTMLAQQENGRTGLLANFHHAAVIIRFSCHLPLLSSVTIMGILPTPVKINGTVCRNCYDVDWARKAEAEDIKKRAVEAAKKAQEAIAPAGSSPDGANGVNHTSSFDNQPVTTFGGSLNDAGVSAASGSAPIAPPPPDTPGQSVNIFA